MDNPQGLKPRKAPEEHSLQRYQVRHTLSYFFTALAIGLLTAPFVMGSAAIGLAVACGFAYSILVLSPTYLAIVTDKPRGK